MNRTLSTLVIRALIIFCPPTVSALADGPTRLVSINHAGTGGGNFDSADYVPPVAFSRFVSISADGRFVAFQSSASNLISSPPTGADNIFLRDNQSGITTLVTVSMDGTTGGNGRSGSPGITPDGRFVVFESDASNLVANDSNGKRDVFLRDLQTGVTRLVSVNVAGTLSGDGDSVLPSVSNDGRFVAFNSRSSNLVATPDNNGLSDVFLRDMQNGVTRLVSINDAGTATGNSGSGGASISADGRFVAFYSTASDLVGPADNNFQADVYVRDMETGTTRLVSVNAAGTDRGNDFSEFPVISANGGFVAFVGLAQDLVPGVAAVHALNVFVRDLQAGVTSLVSVD